MSENLFVNFKRLSMRKPAMLCLNHPHFACWNVVIKIHGRNDWCFDSTLHIGGQTSESEFVDKASHWMKKTLNQTWREKTGGDKQWDIDVICFTRTHWTDCVLI